MFEIILTTLIIAQASSDAVSTQLSVEHVGNYKSIATCDSIAAKLNETVALPSPSVQSNHGNTRSFNISAYMRKSARCVQISD